MVGVRQFDEVTVLNAALEVFWRQGLHGTSMLDLAEATGVQRGSLYNAYGGKEELFLLTFDIYARNFLDAASEALNTTDIERALHAVFTVAIRNMVAGSPARGCLTTKTAVELNSTEPLVRRRLRKLLSDFEDLIRIALSTESKNQRLTLPPSQAAELIVTFTRGLAVMERVHRDPKRLSESAASLVKIMVTSG